MLVEDPDFSCKVIYLVGVLDPGCWYDASRVKAWPFVPPSYRVLFHPCGLGNEGVVNEVVGGARPEVMKVGGNGTLVTPRRIGGVQVFEFCNENKRFWDEPFRCRSY